MISPTIYPRPDSEQSKDTSPTESSRASGLERNQSEEKTFKENAARLRAPRSLPPWIDSYEERYGPVANEQFRLLQPPPRTVPTQHIAAPAAPQRRVSQDGFIDWDDIQLGPAGTPHARIPHLLRYGRASTKGRKWDHLRNADPVIVSGHKPTTPQRSGDWQEFIQASSWGHMANEEAQVVDYRDLEKFQPSFNRPLDLALIPHGQGAANSRRTLHKHLWYFVMRHSLSPLLFRGLVMITSVVALGVSARLFQERHVNERNTPQRTQCIVAIAVDTVAIPYIGYMIWDEYTGKPIGLRSALSKMSLILLDLFFIILKSASTALAFESLIYHNMNTPRISSLAQTLAAFQLLSLISWTMTFTVNIFRTVEKLGGVDDED